MATYTIQTKGEISLEELRTGLYIFLYKLNRIPPHLGIIYNGEVFDITVKGPTLSGDLTNFMDNINLKQIPTVFVRMTIPNFNHTEVQTVIHKHMVTCNKVDKETSCLAPIKLIVGQLYPKISVKDANFIFELLPILMEHNLIEGSYTSSKLKENEEVHISLYTKSDIENCIAALNRKNRTVVN